MSSTHESFDRRHEIHGGSNRNFGFVFTIVFAVIGLLPLRKGHPVRVWALGISAAFVLLTLLKPDALAPLNTVWTKFSLLLSKFTNTIILGLLFFVFFAVAHALMRLAGKDPLRLRHDAGASSYWLPRQPPGPAPASMSQQF
jgi:hypothetical protein